MIVLFGASGHAKPILDIFFQNGETVAKILDDNPKVSEIFGVEVVKNNFDLDYNQNAVISIGNNRIRKKIAKELPFNYIKAVHPKSSVSDLAQLGEGTVVMANVSVNPDALIGEHCILNTGCVIEHDCKIGDYVHISPNASLAGDVSVGEGSHIGIGASVIQGIKIGKWATIGAGAVIIKDIPDFAIVVGNPGKIIKIKTEENEL
ncbi:acetyltransferase [Planobacterium sp. GCR5]|uniref:Acetyltransferase n=1 Tax=Planobacterium oryzisoli TaxID=2771435 RepID=A0A930YV47_9FLAO|nr:acetyltransferase [Planobacterium oryzisoli]